MGIGVVVSEEGGGAYAHMARECSYIYPPSNTIARHGSLP